MTREDFKEFVNIMVNNYKYKKPLEIEYYEDYLVFKGTKYDYSIDTWAIINNFVLNSL